MVGHRSSLSLISLYIQLASNLKPATSHRCLSKFYCAFLWFMEADPDIE